MRIVALAPNSWAGPWMNRQQLLSRLAARHRILYATGALNLWNRDQPAWQQAPWLARKTESDGLIIDQPGRLMSRWPRLPAWDRFAIRHSARRWRRALGGRSAPVVTYLFHPMFAPYVDAIGGAALVYQAYDLYSETPGWAAEDAAAERDLASRADLCVGSSRAIVDHLSGLGASEVLLLPNAVDYARFSQPDLKPPEELTAIPAPRIGYVGSINQKVDLPLLERLAKDRPEWSIVVVGPVGVLDEETANAWSGLQHLANVHIFGPIPHDALPAYFAALDVGLLAYRTGEGLWTRGIYPLKLHEYLASGLPVVSADLPSVQDFDHVVRIATDDKAWLEGIDAALASRSDDVTARRAVARANDWNDRVGLLENALAALPG